MILAEESEREMVERHIREGEEHIARQREIVEQLPPSGELAEMARILLAEYEATLNLHRAHLARLEGMRGDAGRRAPALSVDAAELTATAMEQVAGSPVRCAGRLRLHAHEGTTPMDQHEREQRIREHAHSLWEQEGRPEGRHEDHWRQASDAIDPGHGVRGASDSTSGSVGTDTTSSGGASAGESGSA